MGAVWYYLVLLWLILIFFSIGSLLEKILEQLREINKELKDGKV
jgi:hypothetical protein